jgi:hypothetical protein
LNEKELQIKQLTQQLNNIRFNGLSSPVAHISNFNHQIMAATAVSHPSLILFCVDCVKSTGLA